MAIVLSCACGQKLRAKEEWRGTKVKCPSCGGVLLVPKNSVAEIPARSASSSKPKPAAIAQRNAESDRPRGSRPPAPSAAPAPNPLKRSPDREEPEFDDIEELRPRKVKRKKKKKTSRGFQFPEFDLLGIHMTLRKWLVFVCAAALVGGLAWLLIPRTSCKILECKFVDAYAALEVGDGEGAGLEMLAKRVLGGGAGAPRTASDVLSPGGNMFLIVREAPEVGEAVFLHLHLPNGFLQDHADYVKGTFNIKDSDFLLQGEGKPVKALVVDMEKKAAFLDKVSEVRIGFLGQGAPSAIIPRERPPWFPQGKIENNFNIENLYPDDQKTIGRTQSKRDITRQPDNTITITGTGSFIGKRGMKVDYTFEDVSARVTWDSQSKPYIGTIYHGEGSSEYMFKSLEIIVIFPRPPGNELTLTVMGAKVGKIKPK